MIRKIQVKNFMSLRDTTIELEPLTIFIGPNASGKSAVFKMLVALARLLRAPVRSPTGEFELTRGITLDQLVWRGDNSLPMVFSVWFDEAEQPAYTLELRKVAAGWSVTREILRLDGHSIDSSQEAFEYPTEFGGSIRWTAPYHATLNYLTYRQRNDLQAAEMTAPFVKLGELLGPAWRYRIAAGDIADVVFPPKPPKARIWVGESGRGLAWVLQELQGKDRKTFTAIENRLVEWFPHIQAVNLVGARGGVRIAFTTDRSQELVPAELESDGVLHALFLLWRIHTKEAHGTTVCLEEPENGTHPYFLAKRYEALREAATLGLSGTGATAILVATHSPDFLAAIEDPQTVKDSVRVVEYDSDQGTHVHSLRDLQEVNKLLRVFKGNLGELWWSGAIGGVPRAHGNPNA